MRAITLTLGLGLLAACSPTIPDSAAGVGFNNSQEVQLARDTALTTALTTGQPLVPPSVLSEETLAPVPFVPQDSSAPLSATVIPAASAPVAAQPQSVAGNSTGQAEDIAAETAAALALVSANSGQMPLQANPSNPAPQSQSGISDENDFAAVSGRQSISSDAERIAQNRAQYQVIAPTALPTRTGTSQPNIVEYALQTSNPRGTKVYSRSGFNSAAKAVRNCARFPSPDQAQIAFLTKGGPQKDRQGLDPDGDGYACTWDPAPFRQASKN